MVQNRFAIIAVIAPRAMMSALMTLFPNDVGPTKPPALVSVWPTMLEISSNFFPEGGGGLETTHPQT